MQTPLTRAPEGARPRLVERYRRFLPVTDSTPALTLGEGFTPLVRLTNIGRELGLQNLYAKVEGQNPTGSFKDRAWSWRWRGPSRRAPRRSSAPPPATPPPLRRPTAPPQGSRSWSCCRPAISRSARSSRPSSP